MSGKFLQLFALLFFPPLLIFSSSPEMLCSKPQGKQLLAKRDSVENQDLWNPDNWIVLGGCWDLSTKIFFSQGFKGGNKVYYNKKIFKNFVYEVKIMKIAEDGALGIVFRFDEAKDQGYAFSVFPHGEYIFVKFAGLDHVNLKRGTTAHFNEELNTWNKLKVVALRDKFDCYINDNFVVSVRDNSFQNGRIGLTNSGDPRQIAKFDVLSLVEK